MANQTPRQALRPLVLPSLESWMIGFDRQFKMLESLHGVAPKATYPPYNMRRSGEDSFLLEIAVAGFTRDDVKVRVEENVLVVEGTKALRASASEDEYLHRGIAARNFRQSFALAEHVKVNFAELSDGVLSIGLIREVPEACKPIEITIN